MEATICNYKLIAFHLPHLPYKYLFLCRQQMRNKMKYNILLFKLQYFTILTTAPVKHVTSLKWEGHLKIQLFTNPSGQCNISKSKTFSLQHNQWHELGEALSPVDCYYYELIRWETIFHYYLIKFIFVIY